MCMWQSQAPGGASSLGRSVPDEFGTASCCLGLPIAMRRAYSSSQTSIRAVPWKWLGDMVQPLIFL